MWLFRGVTGSNLPRFRVIDDTVGCLRVVVVLNDGTLTELKAQAAVFISQRLALSTLRQTIVKFKRRLRQSLVI